jgi:hypothetical protein
MWKIWLRPVSTAVILNGNLVAAGPRAAATTIQSRNQKHLVYGPRKTKTRLLAQNCDWIPISYPAEIQVSINAAN